MAIDIRAKVYCNLGEVISGSISDGYVQGTGLILIKGTCEIRGLRSFALGTPVSFSYETPNGTGNIPRTLKVLSCFADPWRGTTKIELGCDLTLNQNAQEPKQWTVFDDPLNSGADPELTPVEDIVTLQINASSVAAECLHAMKIAGSAGRLTNKFSVKKFDFSSGYFNVLSDLLISENLCGYMDNGSFRLIDLTVLGVGGQGLGPDEVIDIGPIGSGPIPAREISCTYNTLKLKIPPPDALSGTDELSPWETIATSSVYDIHVQYTKIDGNGTTRYLIATFNILEETKCTTYYKTITIIKDGAKEKVRVVTQKVTDFTTDFIAIAGGLVTEYLNNNIEIPNDIVRKKIVEDFSYDEAGNEIYYQRFVSGSIGFLAGSAGVPFVFSPTDYVVLDTRIDVPLEAEIRYTYFAGNCTRTATSLYGPWLQTIQGQQTVANSRDSFNTSSQVSTYLRQIWQLGTGVSASGFRGLQLLDTRIEDTAIILPPSFAPSPFDILVASKAKVFNADPNNGYRTYSKSDFTISYGDGIGSVNYQMPYAPDDIFIKNIITGSDGKPKVTFLAFESDAKFKAAAFAATQNKLTHANRNGINIQATVGSLPSKPLGGVYLSLTDSVGGNTLVSKYAANGTTWTFNKDGIIMSTDGLYIGASASSSPTTWVPVAAGIQIPEPIPLTILPVLPVWFISEKITARTSTNVVIKTRNYGLAINTGLNIVTTTNVSLTSATAITVVAPVTAFTFTVYPPTLLNSNKVVTIPATVIAVNSIVPFQVGHPRLEVSVPAATIAVAAKVPSVLSGSAVAVPTATVRISVPYLYVDTGKDPGGQTPGIPDLYTPTQDWQPEPWAS